MQLPRGSTAGTLRIPGSALRTIGALVSSVLLPLTAVVAEADVRKGTAESLTRARTTINVFRARGNQAPLVTTEQATLLAALVDQRRRELFLEGQHLGDLIRFGIAPPPPEGSAFPGGGTYGAQKCFPPPDVERLNDPVLS